MAVGTSSRAAKESLDGRLALLECWEAGGVNLLLGRFTRELCGLSGSAGRFSMMRCM